MLKKENLMRMAETRGEWCVSIYTPIDETNAVKKRLRLKDLTRVAEQKLRLLGAARSDIARMIGPVEMVLDHPGFWENHAGGFAAFFTPESFVWHSLPDVSDDLVVVSDRFHLKPLVRNAAENERFCLLALGENRIRFFEASKSGINEVLIKGLPRNTINLSDPKSDASIFNDEEERTRLLELFRAVDQAVTGYLKNEDAPLILAAAENYHPLYHEANNYPHFVKVGIGADTDLLTPNELLEKALPVVKPFFRRKREKALDAFREKLEKGLATNNFSKIFAAAKSGQIETLFVPVGRRKWGTFDGKTDELFFHERAEPGDKDLLCVASTRTLRKGGEVFVMLPEQMPNNSLIAAVLRS